MLRFLRTIRKNLLEKGKVRTYLVYALGEIILVVIGILIALSINNMKTAADLKKQERQLYADILAELRQDLTDMEGNSNYNDDFLERFKRGSLIILEDSLRLQKDSLAVIAADLTKFSDFKNDQPIYQRLFTSGEQDLVSNKEILGKLKELAGLYNYLNRLETNHQDYMYTILPKIANYIRINPPQIMDLDALYGYRFQNDFEISIIIMEEKKDLYQNGVSQISDLVDNLEYILAQD